MKGSDRTDTLSFSVAIVLEYFSSQVDKDRSCLIDNHNIYS